DVARVVEESKHAERSIDKPCRGVADGDGRRRGLAAGWAREIRRSGSEHQLRDDLWAQFQAEAQSRLFRGGVSELTRYRQIDGGDQVLASAVVVDCPAYRESLGALSDDCQDRAGGRLILRSAIVHPRHENAGDLCRA